jgi:dTMP kinase
MLGFLLSFRYGGERYEKRDMQIRVREKFGKLKKLDECRVTWNTVDASQSMDAVESDIWSIVSESMEACKHKPLKKMWQDGNYDMKMIS